MLQRLSDEGAQGEYLHGSERLVGEVCFAPSSVPSWSSMTVFVTSSLTSMSFSPVSSREAWTFFLVLTILAERMPLSESFIISWMSALWWSVPIVPSSTSPEIGNSSQRSWTRLLMMRPFWKNSPAFETYSYPRSRGWALRKDSSRLGLSMPATVSLTGRYVDPLTSV